MTPAPRRLTIRLVLNSPAQIAADSESVLVGLQDKSQNVHVGNDRPGGSVFFECDVEVRPDKASELPAFFGSFVHGTPSARFLYLSWKRTANVETPWLQRVKIPLSALTWNLIATDGGVEADITGRKPHSSQPILWKTRSHA